MIYEITLHFFDGSFKVLTSEFVPKFSPNFICIAPVGTTTDEFFNITTIKRITVDEVK